MNLNPKISILTPSIRIEGLKIIQECLKNSTFKEYEWLTEIGIPERGHDLNQAFNRMIKRAKGELLIFCEDFNKFPPDALEKWWSAYQECPNTAFTAPLGKVDDFQSKDIKWDWRAYKQNDSQTDYTDCNWNTLELDWGAIPKKMLYDIGGFEEKLDQWWSMDNVAVGKLLHLKGYQFKCLFSNPAIVYDHDTHSPHPFRAKYNSEEANEIINSYNPETILPYLDVI